MKLLLTNDDGIQGEGLCALVLACERAGHETFVVAPKENNSAVSHRIHLRSAVPMEELGPRRYALGGTPADCVIYALHLLNLRPDLILSGINLGLNAGSDVLYSGTVSAALEGAQNGVPAIALSQYLHGLDGAESRRAAFERAAELLIQNLDAWYQMSRETGALNINFPSEEPRGVRFCPQSHTDYRLRCAQTKEGLTMEFHSSDPKDGGDLSQIKAGYLTITPLKMDFTDYEALKRWQNQV